MYRFFLILVMLGVSGCKIETLAGPCDKVTNTRWREAYLNNPSGFVPDTTTYYLLWCDGGKTR